MALIEPLVLTILSKSGGQWFELIFFPARDGGGSLLQTYCTHLAIMELFIRETSLSRNEHLGICTLLPYKLSSL